MGGKGGAIVLSWKSFKEYLLGELLLRPSRLRCDVLVRQGHRRPGQPGTPSRSTWRGRQALQGAVQTLDNVYRLTFKVSGSSTSLICSLNDSVTFCICCLNVSVPEYLLGSFLTVFTSEDLLFVHHDEYAFLHVLSTFTKAVLKSCLLIPKSEPRWGE